MSGIGPVEPGEGTHPRDVLEPGAPLLSDPPRGRLAQLYARHHRAALTATATAALLAAGGYLFATRPQKPPPPPAPYPSQVVDVTYRGPATPPGTAPRGSFSFALELSVQSGPPVTTTRITQPYASVSLTWHPHPPLRTRAGSPRKITITMHVTECAKVPENAGLPFLDVTLRNTRAIQVHSFILGDRYAHDLSQALHVACSTNSTSGPK
ncbi:Tat pathway signal sequence domain protein [Streptomyces sp. NBC_01136]|uniref:Tat pathway signal sequence domain protein n=1 Tax=Streptomyces sp. NBC_01136 TaxID=2903754 RepID=UPI003869126D|nr:Tat pathway signal sequence domain protein [Streptomyces sp. NBC_01136]